MIFRDVIQERIESQKEDGMGGFASNPPIMRDIPCKASLSFATSGAPEYGVLDVKILNVATFEQLDKEAFYFFDETRFRIRSRSHNNRIYYYTLVEVK